MRKIVWAWNYMSYHPEGLTISQSSKIRKDPNVASSWLSLISRLITCTGEYVDEPWASNPAAIRVHVWIPLMWCRKRSNTEHLSQLEIRQFWLIWSYEAKTEDSEMEHMEDWEDWWLSGCWRSVVEHWQLQPGILSQQMLVVHFPVFASCLICLV